MRPTGVVLIAIYHFLSALVLLLFATFLVVGGTVLGALFASGHESPLGGLGMMVGMLGAVLFFLYAVVAFVAGYGVWSLREWGRILSIVLAVVSLLFSLPGLLLMGLHFHLFFGTYRLFRIAISILIIWYLVQPPIKALFQRAVPAAPVS
jgi:hypothetical protein